MSTAQTLLQCNINMIPVYTQKKLDKLTWNQVQKLHKSLGLKATGARTRRHLQHNILAAMPQRSLPEAIATPLTCANCPLARNIEDSRYSCTADVVGYATRGHWEARTECYQVVADAQPKTATAETLIAPESIIPELITPEEIAVVKTKISLAERMTGLTRHPFRYEWDVMNGSHCFTSAMYGLCECSRCEVERELPLSEQRRGSHQIAIERSHRKKKTQITETKVQQFTIDRSILTLEPESLSSSVDPEGTIHWETLFNGTIVGKRGVLRRFWLRTVCDGFFADKNSRHDPNQYEIQVVISDTFVESESRRPNNVRIVQIREAINLGRLFDAKAFKSSPNFERDTEACNGGRIRQECDGRWWAWAEQGITGHTHSCREDACKYLERIANLLCVK